MRPLPKYMFAGLAALACAGSAWAAESAASRHADPNLRVVKVMMPDGSVQQLRYRVAAQPRLIFVPVRAAFAPLALRDADMFRSFAMMDRIAAQMDRQFDAMMRQAAMLSAAAEGGNGGPTLAGAPSLPPGTISYSFTSTSTAAGTCSRSVRVTSLGPAQAPKVVSQSSGDCGGTKAPAAATPATKALPDLRDTI